ncbi:MAG TPA: hypothetical protein VLT33_14335, partial [Labilithrix sp.]|nr:hypothetical protein [Labilithrix sp.]
MSPRGTAHGKVILFGEHAVVYGVPALAVGIDRGAWAEATPSADAAAKSVMYVRGWDVTVNDAAADESPSLARAFHGLLAATRAAQRAAGEPPVAAV